jgi:hypothetical protein
MTTVGRLKNGDFYVLDGFNERIQQVTNGLIAHHPLDGNMDNMMMTYRNSLISATDTNFYGTQFIDHDYSNAQFAIYGSVRSVDAPSNVTTTIGFSYLDASNAQKWVAVKTFNLFDIQKWINFSATYVIPADYNSALQPWIQINIPGATPGYKIEYQNIRYFSISPNGLAFSNINLRSDGLAIDKAATNLLVNSSFEVDANADGLADSWSYFIGLTGVDGSRVAIYSRAISSIQPNYNQRLYLDSIGNSNDSGIFQNISGITAGLDYTFSVYAKTNTISKFLIELNFRDSGNVLLQTTASPVISEINKIIRLRVTATAPIGTVSAQVTIRGINAAKEWFEVDAALLTQSSDLTSYTETSSGDSSFKLPKNYIKSTGSIAFDFMPLMYSNQNPIFSSGIDGGFDLLIQSGPSSATSTLRFFSAIATSIENTGNWFPNLNKFYKIILTWVNNDQANLYIDGTLVLTVPNCGDWFSYYTSAGSGLWLGNGIRSVTSMIFRNVSFFNKVLSLTEVARLNNSIFELRKDNDAFGTMHTSFSERPMNIGNDYYYLPLGDYDGKDLGKVISPIAFSNIQILNGYNWVGGSTINLLFDGNIKNWVFNPSLAPDYSIIEVLQNERYVIRRIASVGTGLFQLQVPLAKLTNGLTYTFSFKFKFLSGNTLNFVDWCGTMFMNSYRLSKNGYYYVILTGSAATYSSTIRHLTLSMPAATEIEIWDLQLEQKSFYTPYTKSTGLSKITYNLYNSIGLDWSADWSILYWKIPIGSSNNLDLSGYNIESLGSTTNTIGGGYLWWGKTTGVDAFQVSGLPAKAMDPMMHSNMTHMISVIKSGSNITVNFWMLGQIMFSFIKPITISVANYFVNQYGYDFKLGGFDDSNPTNSFYRDLLIYKRALSDAEVLAIYTNQMKYKSSTLYIQGGLIEDLQV